MSTKLRNTNKAGDSPNNRSQNFNERKVTFDGSNVDESGQIMTTLNTKIITKLENNLHVKQKEAERYRMQQWNKEDEITDLKDNFLKKESDLLNSNQKLMYQIEELRSKAITLEDQLTKEKLTNSLEFGCNASKVQSWL